MKYEILKLLSNNAKYTACEIATMLGSSEAEVSNTIKELEKDGFIRGYKAVIDCDKLDGAYVSAVV
ncbi:MAG: Lrp/AsnC family transcriptional regulator, partial [Clostridia bacterium]|nr:Lrp/AsnC family transcriptional regulator [Clostridia bacterium]